MYMGKTVTCQWNFRECAKMQLSSVNLLEKEIFKSLYSQICYASTASEYERISNNLEQICERNNIMTWWNWWKARHFYIVPAFKGFCVSGLNMEESGQSEMKTRGKMWLSVAAWRDTCTMIIQDRDYISFYTYKAKVTGKGLNLMQQRERERERERDRRAERNFINSACDTLKSGDIEAEVLIEMDPSCYFVSNKRTRHKVPAKLQQWKPISREDKRWTEA